MTETLPPDVLMDAAQIDEAALFINERVAAHVYNGSIEIGDFVLAKFFGNDLNLAGSRNSYKPVSYRKLCRHPDLSVSSTTLMNMVKTAAQEQSLIAGGIPVDKLKYSQKVALTRMENTEEKLELARACIDEQLTVEELNQRIREITQQSVNQIASPVIQVEKYLTRVERWIRRASAPEGMTNFGYIGNLSPADKEKILDSAGGILEDMSVITNRIRMLVTVLTQPPTPPVIEGDSPS